MYTMKYLQYVMLYLALSLVKLYIYICNRTVHVLRLWLQYHPQDFIEGSELYRKFQEFLLEMAE